MTDKGPRVGLWGTFDVDNYGDHLFPLVAAHELRRRLPDADVRVYSPYGWLHPTRFDGTGPVAPLGPWSRGRVAGLAAMLDAVVIGGGEIIHLNDPMLAPVYDAAPAEAARMAPSRFFVEGLGPALEAQCPVAWNAVGVPFDLSGEQAARVRAALAGRAYVAVRDELSERRLRDAGVERDIAVVPDTAVLVSRVLAPADLALRLGRLRLSGHYPADADALVVQGNSELVPFAGELAAAVEHWSAENPHTAVVIVETGPCRGDGRFADAVQGRLAGAFRLPIDSGVEDVAAAIAGSVGFVGSSLHGSITALSSGCPFVVLNLAPESKLEGFGRMIERPGVVVSDIAGVGAAMRLAFSSRGAPPDLASLQRRVDVHFDRLTAMIETSAQRRRGRHPHVARPGHADRDGALAYVDGLRRQLATAGRPTADIEAELATARLAATMASAELDRVTSTRTWRYAALPRRLYGRFLRSR